MLVGNKGDLEEKRAVPEPDATAYARDAGFEAVQVASSASSKLYKTFAGTAMCCCDDCQ